MTRSLLHATVARLTGESLATIQQLGFRLNRRDRPDRPDGDSPLVVMDCPFCGATVVLAWDCNDDLPEYADCRRCETVFSYSTHEIRETDLSDVSVPAPRTYAPAA
jgi:hypothetical protein